MSKVAVIGKHKLFNGVPLILSINHMRVSKIRKNSYLQKISVTLLFHLPRPF